MISILFVDDENTFRSPMAEFVMKDLVRKAGKEKDFYIESAAISNPVVGAPVDDEASLKLAEHGISCHGKTTRRMVDEDYARFDLIIGMTEWDYRRIFQGSDPFHKIHLLLNFTERGGEVTDPWYSGDFEAVWLDILEGCQTLLSKLLKQL